MDTPLQRGDNGGPATTVPQQAIRTLSLRVPQTTSVPGVAPLPLLNATGGGGTDLDMLLQALLKAFGPNALTTGGPGRSSATPPRIRPPFNDPNAPINIERLASQIPEGRMAELARRTGGNTGFTGGRGPMGPMEPIGGQSGLPNIQPLF